MPGRIGVCSWSLSPGSPAELVEGLRRVGIDAVQLALDPIRRGEWDERETIATLRDAGIDILSGMMTMAGEDYSTLESIRRTGGVRLDEYWEANLAAAGENAALAERLGVGLVTFHAGFIPDDPTDPKRDLMVDRLGQIIDRFADRGVSAAFETGQETAETLLGALDEIDRPTLGVNFDPANMILYGMGDPVRAIELLAPRVSQVHIKDAVATNEPGTWGTEVRAGTGEVNWPRFFDVLRSRTVRCDLLIEREAGEDRTEDIKAAHEMVVSLLK
ncbi:MAG: sugar phosphate isomerase/epimerase [Planctomycetes bacterium]|nr:sugar phosphate isomerase/epimerase [Planctomycetota bacterium]